MTFKETDDQRLLQIADAGEVHHGELIRTIFLFDSSFVQSAMRNRQIGFLNNLGFSD